MMRDFPASVRYAARGLRKQAGFTLVVLLILALGIGANTIIFSIAYGVLLHPLSYRQSSRLVQLWPEDYVNKLLAVTVAENSRTFESASPYQSLIFAISGSGDPESTKGARVGTDFFRVLGASPLLGRTFSAEEGRPRQNNVVVLSNDLWQQHYGGDGQILRKSITIDGVAHQVIGVMPVDFRPLEPGWKLWVPLSIDRADAQDFESSFYLKLIAKLAPGVSVAQAEKNLHAICRNLRTTYPNLMTNEKIEMARVVPLQEHLIKSIRPVLMILLWAVGLMLLIVCVNVATLLLSRTLRRRGEFAIRAALGAKRSQLIRDVLAESLLLGMLGGALGLTIARSGLALFLGSFPMDLPRADEVVINGPVLAFTLLASLLAALVFSLWPARRAFHLELLSELRAETGASIDRTSRRFGRTLVAIQVAFAVILLTSAGLLLKSLWRLESVKPGFQQANYLTLRLDLPASRYSEPHRIVDYYRRVFDQTRTIPGVASLGAIHLLPLTDDNWAFPYRAQGDPATTGLPAGAALPDANFRVVTPSYFQTLGIRLYEGRFFMDSDDESATSVGLINRTLAEKLWPGRSALGKTIQHFGDGGPVFTVVGVVDDVHQHHLDEDPRPEIYRPYTQWPANSMYLILRTSLPPLALASSVRTAIWSIDPEIPIADMRPLDQVIQASVRNQRSTGILVSSFAGFALFLAMIGLYGVINYTVRQRAREIRIRMALGAQRRHVIQAILREGLAVTATGLLLGFVGAMICSRILEARLFQTARSDTGIYLLVACLILGSSLVSSLLPAWRAARPSTSS
jgi:putative ABC transport system permease protein